MESHSQFNLQMDLSKSAMFVWLQLAAHNPQWSLLWGFGGVSLYQSGSDCKQGSLHYRN